MSNSSVSSAKHERVLNRLIDAPREKVFRCWIEPELLKQWFCPKPWSVSDAEIDARGGGAFNTTMRGLEGEVMPNLGCFLEVVKNERSSRRMVSPPVGSPAKMRRSWSRK
jgi:uncharacterized protein YndB with AHSA1/START domain